MKKIAVIMIWIIPIFADAQIYNVLLIPDSLLKHANAVMRTEEYNISIKSIGSAIVKQKYAITVLNENGDKFAQFTTFYSQFVKINDISGKLYDASGKLIKSVKKRDMEDRAYEDEISLMTDDRYKSHDFYCKTYPYTVEYEEEDEYNGIHMLPKLEPCGSPGFSVEHSKMTVEMPINYHLRYKSLNSAPEPERINNDKSVILKWQINHFKAFEYESFQPAYADVVPVVIIAPEDFEYGGYKGNMSTWDNYARYYSDLYKGRDQLPDNVKEEVHKLTDHIQDKEEKIRILYHFMQQNTHYISIQLGIGGLQPFDAKYVASKKYGDCKALSNYMYSLLKEAGIRSHQVIIYGGRNFEKVKEDFPSDYFNHVVVCVPDVRNKDSLWLECTSQTESPGFMGSFTGNRQALLVTESGGKLVNTPIYNEQENVQVRKITASVDADGNLTALIDTRRTGTLQEFQHDLMYEASKEEREKYLNRSLGLATFKVEKSDYVEKKGRIPEIEEKLTIRSDNYASVSGKRFFISPNPFSREDKLATDDNRKYNIEFKFGGHETDSVSIKIPDGYIVESIPKNITEHNQFGSYQINYSINGNVVSMYRDRIRKAGVFLPNTYKDLVAFYDLMNKADRAKLVFVKKGE